MVRKTLFKAIAKGIYSVAVGEKDQVQLWIHQEQMRIESQEAEWWGQQTENHKEETTKVGGFLLNWPNRILTKGRWVLRHQGWWWEFDQIPRMGDSLSADFAGSLLGLAKMNMEGWGQGLVGKRPQRSLTKVWLKRLVIKDALLVPFPWCPWWT